MAAAFSARSDRGTPSGSARPMSSTNASSNCAAWPNLIPFLTITAAGAVNSSTTRAGSCPAMYRHRWRLRLCANRLWRSAQKSPCPKAPWKSGEPLVFVVRVVVAKECFAVDVKIVNDEHIDDHHQQ